MTKNEFNKSCDELGISIFGVNPENFKDKKDIEQFRNILLEELERAEKSGESLTVNKPDFHEFNGCKTVDEVATKAVELGKKFLAIIKGL